MNKDSNENAVNVVLKTFQRFDFASLCSLRSEEHHRRVLFQLTSCAIAASRIICSFAYQDHFGIHHAAPDETHLEKFVEDCRHPSSIQSVGRNGLESGDWLASNFHSVEESESVYGMCHTVRFCAVYRRHCVDQHF